MLIVTMLALWLTVVIAPDTPIGKAIQRWTIDVPARQLSRIRRDTFLTMTILLGAIILVSLFSSEAGRILSFGAPEAAAWLSVVELGTYLDIAFAALLVAPALRLSAIKRWIAIAGARLRRGAHRPVRTRRPRTGERAANDDDHPARIYAVAA